MAKLTLNMPNYPEGEEIEVQGVGLVKNGSTVELPEGYVDPRTGEAPTEDMVLGVADAQLPPVKSEDTDAPATKASSRTVKSAKETS